LDLLRAEGGKLKVAVLGWYGHGNFGDELILEGLRILFRDWQIRVYSSDDTGAYPMIEFDAVNKCDLFVLGGGELIGSKHLWMPAPCRFKPHTKLYRLYCHTPFSRRSWINRINIPKVILGCGVDAEKAELEANVIRDLEQFDYIGLRDNAAVSILRSFPQLESKTHLFYDLAFAINGEPSIITFLARLFPFKLHGLILAHMASISYTFYPYPRKLQRVRDTITGLDPDEIREKQRRAFKEILEIPLRRFGHAWNR
jgi:polysaccharide pyruvyl transferase WcaK-like protein